MVSAAGLALTGLVSALLLVFLTLATLRRAGWYAQPNERSFHATPTPSMGGLGLVLIVLAHMLWVWHDTPLTLPGWVPLGLAVVALLGLWDDLSELSARLRLVVHLLAAGMVVYGVSVSPVNAVDGLLHNTVPMMLCALALAWLLNLYNFMDGIDGIAAAQCLLFCLAAHGLTLGIPGWVGDSLWLLAGAALGFLVFNWPPAKLFMGDVGSGFLGLLLGFYVLWLWQWSVLPLVASLVLLSAFWFDATYTLCVRILTGQEFTKAHRSHLYQRVAERQGHLWTTVCFLLYGLVWLVPLAWACIQFPHWQLLILLGAVIPLAIACWRLRAGLPAPTAGQPMG